MDPSWTFTTTIGFRVIPLVPMPSTASTTTIDYPSVFDVLNLFRACWYLNHKHLLSLVLSAVKGGKDNAITWIDLLPQAHTHLLCQAVALAPPSYPLSLLKRVMFTFLLEVVNSPALSLDHFVKRTAPRCHCKVSTLAPSHLLDASAPVRNTKAQHSGTIPAAPKVLAPAPPPSTPSTPIDIAISTAILQLESETHPQSIESPDEEDVDDPDYFNKHAHALTTVLPRIYLNRHPSEVPDIYHHLLPIPEKSPPTATTSQQPTRKSNRKPKPPRPFEA